MVHWTLPRLCSARTWVPHLAWPSGLKDPALLQLWHRLQVWFRSDPWPKKSMCHRAAQKGKERKKRGRERDNEREEEAKKGQKTIYYK